MTSRDQLQKDLQAEFVSVLPDDADVGLEDGRQPDDRVGVYYRDLYREYPFNQASSAPVEYQRDNNGHVEYEVYADWIEGLYSLRITAPEQEGGKRANMYELLVDHFGRYRHRPWDPAEINADIEQIRIQPTDPDDDIFDQQVIRGDILQISVVFKRTYRYEDDTIQDVNLTVNAE